MNILKLIIIFTFFFTFEELSAKTRPMQDCIYIPYNYKVLNIKKTSKNGIKGIKLTILNEKTKKYYKFLPCPNPRKRRFKVKTWMSNYITLKLNPASSLIDIIMRKLDIIQNYNILVYSGFILGFILLKFIGI